MNIREKGSCWLAGVSALGITVIASFCAQEPKSLPLRILKWTDAEQVACINSYLREGAVAPTEALGVLVRSKSSLTMPILEKEIEEVLRSTSSRELFSNPSADPQKVVNTAAAMIQFAGNEQSLREASKLIKLDEHRFGDVVYNSLLQAAANGNPFLLAYRGFEIRDPEVDKRIIQWVDKWLNLGEDYDHIRAKRAWAEAMVEKYDGVPHGAEWTADPIVSRLDPAKYLGLHDEMLPITIEVAQRRSKR